MDPTMKPTVDPTMKPTMRPTCDVGDEYTQVSDNTCLWCSCYNGGENCADLTERATLFSMYYFQYNTTVYPRMMTYFTDDLGCDLEVACSPLCL